jgi:copper transport protein
VALLAVLAFVVPKVWASARWSPPGAVVVVLTAVGMLGTFALSGHAAGASARALGLLSDTVHLTAMACWLGGLLVLGTRLLRNVPPQELRDTLPRWSRTAMTCVALLVLTGGYQAWREIGTLPALTGTPYGRLLILKLAGFAALLLLGNLGRLWVQRGVRDVPPTARYVAGSSAVATAAQTQPELRVLRRSVIAEVAIGIAVLGVTAALVTTTPGRNAIRAQQTPATSGATSGQAPEVSATSSMTLPGGILVTVSADPPVAASAVIELRVEKPDGASLDPVEVRVVAAMPQRGLAGLPLPLHRVSPGNYAAHDATLPFPGQWRITVTVRTSDVDAGVGTTTITLR